jgi:hypothetical protein
MLAYREGVNVDRLITFCALASFAAVQQSNRGYTKRVENEEKHLDNNQKLSNLFTSPFRHIGQGVKQSGRPKGHRRAFKNLGR